MGYFKLSDAMPMLENILRAEKGEALVKPPHKPNRFFCERCRHYHLIYSNIGNDHRDYDISTLTTEYRAGGKGASNGTM